MTAGLPINPPTGPFVMRAELEARDVTFTDGLAYDAGFWFWVYADRPWAVGPYRQRQAAERARDRYLRLPAGPARRVWHA